MAQRLRMTNADYVAIAVSPALIMALVGSLVFFLIEVLYVGSYPFRLNYVFALFVFATVLIARIAIEMGSERAAMFSLPLGILTFLAMGRFVDLGTSFSWLINLALLGVVWWCAHKLTWDCTVIDDNEDASGEGLLGQVGLDERDDGVASAPAVADNELFADATCAQPAPWWRRLFAPKKGLHSPGLWVLYFSLAALPLFGIGQHWIPAGDVSRRRYAFGLLAVYVASALSLLVTTSFLGLRRYLRQRRVEMPAPMAATWVSLGAVLILLVMFAAALIPRPGAEYAISQAPWQAGSPDHLAASRYSVGNEGTDDPTTENRVTSDNAEGPPGDETGAQQDSSPGGEPADGEASQQGGSEQGSQQGSSNSQGDQSGGQSSSDSSEPSDQQDASSIEKQSTDAASKDTADSRDSQAQGQEEQGGGPEQSSTGSSEEQEGTPAEDSSMSKMFEHSNPANPAQLLQSLTLSLTSALKLLFYVLLALGIVYLAWRNRETIARTFAEILRQLREFFARLFGGGAATAGAADGDAFSAPHRRTFAEFKDPFASGRHTQIAPVELVRYTFEAFEAWAGDRGRPRTPDQTPQELVRGALAPQTPMYAKARQMVQLYSEAAYASATISREAANTLQSLWQMMRSANNSREKAQEPQKEFSK